MDVMVTDISESRLILLFIEGLAEPLKGLVKAYRPTTQQEAVSKTRDLHDAISRTKYPPSHPMPHKFQNQRPPMRKFHALGKRVYSYKDRDELRRKWEEKTLFFLPRTLGSRPQVCEGKSTLY